MIHEFHEYISMCNLFISHTPMNRFITKWKTPYYAHINSNSKYSNKCNRLFFRPFFYGFKHGMTKVTFCFLCLPLRTSQYCLCIYGEVQVQVTLFLLPQFDAQPVFITTYIKLNTFLSITTIKLCKQTFICYKIIRRINKFIINII